jgi:hypothetical protein
LVRERIGGRLALLHSLERLVDVHAVPDRDHAGSDRR